MLEERFSNSEISFISKIQRNMKETFLGSYRQFGFAVFGGDDSDVNNEK